MSDTRTYIVPDGQENSTNQMLPWMAMMNGGMGGFGNGMWNNPFMYLVWMWMMRWMNRGEFGEGNNCQNLQSAEIQGQLAGLREQMNTNQNTQLLMDAIKGNSAALGQLATNLNCDFGVLKDCCCNIQNAITTVGGQGGYTSERVINAVERGNCDVIQAINNCCCNTQKAIIEQGYQNQLANERQTYQITNSVDSVGRAVERGFCDTAYATQTQTCSLQNTIRDTGTANTNQIIAKLDAMQNQALLDKIDALREKNSQQAVVINNAQQTAAFGQMIGQATSPIVAAVNALQSDVNGIKCKLPETVTLPYSCATAVPTQAVFNGYALGTYAGWNGCGCNNSLWG